MTDEFRKVLSVGLIIGFMDGLAACINGYFSSSIMPGRIFQYIASGFYGVQAFSGGFSMIILGILIHFFIAIVVTVIFFLIYNNKFFRREFYLLYGALYGILIWGVMNYVVIPFSAVSPSDPGTTQIIISVMIHIFIVGIPIGLFAGKDTNYSFDSLLNQKKR